MTQKKTTETEQNNNDFNSFVKSIAEEEGFDDEKALMLVSEFFPTFKQLATINFELLQNDDAICLLMDVISRQPYNEGANMMRDFKRLHKTYKKIK